MGRCYKALPKVKGRRPLVRKLALKGRPGSAQRWPLAHGEALRRPSRSLYQPWPLTSLRAFDLGELGWGKLLRKVLRSRGWTVGIPCHHDDECVWTREFEAMLQQVSPSQAFGARGAVQEGYRMRILPLPSRALWMMSESEYRVPGPNTRATLRSELGRLVAKYGETLPGVRGGAFHFIGFPSMDNVLAKTEFAEYFSDAPWFPKCFVIPQERAVLLQRLKTSPHEYWTTKPRNLCSGAGICVWRADDPELAAHVLDSKGKTRSVVQRYVANPLLLGGYKFHMRVHLFIKCLSPPEAYVQAGGQCLCSTKAYTLNRETLGSSFDAPVHISNTGLNMKPDQKDGFLKKKPVIGRGQQITIRQMEAHLARCQPDFDREAMWGHILRIARDTVLYVAQAQATRQNGRAVHGVPGLFFDILGLDLILDNKFKIWMCEANSTPGLSDQAETVHGIPNPDFEKEHVALSKVWHDSLTLVGLDASQKQSEGTLRGWYVVDFSTA